MVALKPLLLGASIALPLSLLSYPAEGTEEPFVRTATRAAELGKGWSLSNRRKPDQFPELQRGPLPLMNTADRLRQSEIVVRDRCIQRPLFDQTLAFGCKPVVLPANVGGAGAENIPEIGTTNLEQLDAELSPGNIPLNSASDSPDPLGLGVQLRL